MRRRKNHRSFDARTSALAHAAKAAKRLAGPFEDRPTVPAGMMLHRIRVESFVGGTGFEVLVRQGPRRNQIVMETFGRASRPSGLDRLTREMRKRLVVRWAPGTRVEKG